MNNVFQDAVQIIEPYTIPVAIGLLVIVVVLFFYRKKINQGWLNLKNRYYLNRLGLKQITGLKCPDGLGYHFIIDRLILRHDGITLLAYKRYPGKIFCADQIDDWTQMVGKKSYRFKNPLYDLDCQVKAISDCVPDAPVDGYLFFDHLTEFPKGKSDRIVQLDDMPEKLKRSKGAEVEAPVLAAWESLVRMSKG